MAKQYTVRYESDECVCGSYLHTWGNYSTLKNAISGIAKLLKADAANNPRKIAIYDCWVDGPAEIVYEHGQA